jgi:hypothetical protein
MFSTNVPKRSLKIVDLFEIVNDAYHGDNESFYNTLHHVLDSDIVDIHELETRMDEFKSTCDYVLEERETQTHFANLETILTLPAVVDYLGGKHVMDLCHLIWNASGNGYCDSTSCDEYEGTSTYNNSTSDEEEYIEGESSDEDVHQTFAYRHRLSIDDIEDDDEDSDTEDDTQHVVASKLVYRGKSAIEKSTVKEERRDEDDEDDDFTVHCLEKHKHILHPTLRFLEFVLAAFVFLIIYSVLQRCYSRDDMSWDTSPLPFTTTAYAISDYPQGQ